MTVLVFDGEVVLPIRGGSAETIGGALTPENVNARSFRTSVVGCWTMKFGLTPRGGLTGWS